MKKLLLLIALGVGASASATTINAPAELTGYDSLNGDNAYLWTVGDGTIVAPGQSLSSVTVSFNDVSEIVAGNGNDITIDLGSFAAMPVGQASVPSVGHSASIYDGDAAGDAFQSNINSGDAVRLGTIDFASLDTPESLSVTLTSDELSALDNYMKGGAWGLEIDPDCHFSVGSISLNHTSKNNHVPDNGSTVAMLGLALASLATVKWKLCPN